MLQPRPAGTESDGTPARQPCPRRGRSQRAALARAGLVALLLVARAARAQDDFDAQLQTVASIHFAGANHVAAGELKRALRTRPPSIWPWAQATTFRPDFLVSDTTAIRGVYLNHGYLDARVDSVSVRPLHDPREVAIVYHVHEGEVSTIRAVSLEGVERPFDPPVRKVLRARAGRAFNPLYLVVDTAAVARVYRDRGYNPRVTSSWRRGMPDSLAIAVGYQVLQGPLYHVGETYVSSPGQVRVKEHLIRRELLLRPGSVFRISKVEESQQRLYDTGLFSQVQITALPDSTNRLMEFDLRVQERKPRWIDAGVGSGTTERFRFVGDWGHRNILGRGLQGTVSGLLSVDSDWKLLRSRGEASLLEPWSFHTRTRAQPVVYLEKGNDRSVPLFGTGTFDRHYTARGASIQLNRNLALRTRLYLVQDNTLVHQTFSINPPAAPDTLPASTLDSLRLEVPRDYRTHRITLGFERDVRDNPLSPTLGSTQDVSAALAGGPLHGGSYLFDRLQGSATWYRPVRGWTLALRVRGGVIQPFGEAQSFTPELNLDADVRRVPLDDRFRLGGVNSIRGYNENDIPPSGGLLMALANAELRMPVLGPFGIELYVDAGNVWARPGYIRSGQLAPRVSDEPLDGGDVRYVVGVGPRLELPFGPLRLDFTWSLRPELQANGTRQWRVAEPQFAIGPSF